MKKFYLLLLITIFGSIHQSNAQCVFSIINMPVTCDSTCSGTIAMQLSGGQLPLTMNVSINGAPLNPMTVTTFWQYGNLCPGDVIDFLIVDAVGDTCTGPGSIQVVNVPGPDAVVNVINATCSVCNDGTASVVSVTGGSPPYTYNWSNGSTSTTITNLLPGIYYLYTTDASGCTSIDSVIIGIGNNGFYALQGTVYYDINSNGSKDVGEPGLSNQSVTIAQGTVSAITNSQGDYAFVVAPGTYDVAYNSVPSWNLTSSPSTYNSTISTASISGLDFGLYPDTTYLSATTSLYSGFPRCFWTIPYYLTIYNSGFTNLSGSFTFTHDPALTYVSSSVPPSGSAGNVYTYQFSNVAPGQSFTVMVSLTEPAGGVMLSSTFDVAATDQIGNSYTDSKNLVQTTSCSYDPNDKAVQPIGIGALNYVAQDSWLDYMIRFQNTGNDTAFTVFILDTINAGLDMNTFTFISSSHSVDITTRPGNEVEFRFNNILLPDSIVDEPGSHGYVLYRIKGKPTNPDPTTVSNTAYIYFDLNLPVVTNTTVTTFSDNFLGVADVSGEASLFNLFPNPMSHGAILKYEGPSNEAITVELMDLSGRNVIPSQKMQNGSLFISNKGLSSGTYIVKINAATVSYIRLVVQ